MAVALLLGRIRDARRVEVSLQKKSKKKSVFGVWWFSQVVLALLIER